MILTLENDTLCVKINTVGPELWEITDKRDGLSRLWNGDPSVWAKRSPTLFPVIGMVKNGRAQFGSDVYPMDKHGFLRNAEFAVKEQGNDFVTFTLSANEETRKHYPFDFTLDVTYTLCDATVSVRWDVKNESKTDLPFQIGGHPAFRIPLTADEGFEDYKLIFDEKEDLISLRIDKNGEVREDVTVLAKNENILPVKYSYFDDDALIFKGLRSSHFTLVSGVSSKGVRMDITGIPYLGLWTMKGAFAPYLCLEPWYGVNSKQTDSELFLAKEGLQFVSPGETWQGGYSFEIF